VRRVARRWATLGLLVSSTVAAAPSYTGDPATSRLDFTARAEGADFTGRFERFSTSAVFDPREPANGSLWATVDVASVDTANGQRDELLLGTEWFEATKFAAAEFRSTAIVATGTGFRATGTLSIRSVTRPVQLDFSWTPDPRTGTARLKGTAKLQRLDFDLGRGDWRDTRYIGNDVLVRVDVRYRPANARVQNKNPSESPPETP
jgi:polyisoprenoid-binding protein YceI